MELGRVLPQNLTGDERMVGQHPTYELAPQLVRIGEATGTALEEKRTVARRVGDDA